MRALAAALRLLYPRAVSYTHLNLVKALGNSAITYLVYKPISKLVFGREGPVLTTSAK